MNGSRQYELVYVVSPQASEQEVTDLHTQIEATVTRFGAQLAKTENWGRRKLAYEIGGHKEATYVLEVIDGGGDAMKEIDRRLKVNEQVLRHLVVRVDEELKAADRTRTRRQVEAQRRAAKRPAPPAPPAETAAAPVEGAGEEEFGEEPEA
jgi:small subunit ribosomal protein S6